MPIKRAESFPPETNQDVDYVIKYRFGGYERPVAQDQFSKLIKALASVGIQASVRNGDEHTLLVFTKLASEQFLYQEVYRSRVKDWMHGVKSSAPDKDVKSALDDEPLEVAERLRIVYQLITNPIDEGGAGITPRIGEWRNVDQIFALHDRSYNHAWLKHMASSYFISSEDLDEIRNRFGEKIAFYFAFTEAYFLALGGVSIFGASAWLLLGSFSPIFAIINSFLCVFFTEYWSFQERDLALKWGVKGVSTIETKRKSFKADSIIEDPVTGEKVKTFPGQKRMVRQLLQIPFALTAVFLLGALIAGCFAIEIFVSEVYDGPGKSALVFLPTGIITLTEPLVLGLLSSLAKRLNDYENYATDGAYETAMTQKIFVLNFITSYLPVFLTAFVYVPFASILVPYLDVFNLTVRSSSDGSKNAGGISGFNIDPNRLKQQVIYFTVTAQIVNQFLEVGLPWIKRQGFWKYKQYQSQRAVKRGQVDVSANDAPEEAVFLKRVRYEAELEEYDVTVDFREMVIQYGYLTLFSVVWPLTPISFLVNNWIELRTDAVKICTEMQRPIPWRADSIGPWIDSLGFLTWLGSISTGAIVYLFSGGGLGPDGKPHAIKGWALLLTLTFSEHLYLLVKIAVRYGISKLDSPGRLKEKSERYLIRKKYLEESFGVDVYSVAGSGTATGAGVNTPTDADTGMDTSTSADSITRAALEEAARRGAASSGRKPEDLFWARQRGPDETVRIAIHLMEQDAANETKKSK